MPVLRIRTGSEYQRILKARRAACGSVLELFCYDAGLDYPRLGVIIGKKALKRAVDRNRFKRLVRESFRHLTTNLAAKDYVIRLRFFKRFDRVGLGLVRQDADQLLSSFVKAESTPL